MYIFLILTQGHFFPLLFLKDFIYLILDRGKGREKKREINVNMWLPLAHPELGTWPATQACALAGNQTSDPLVHRLALNQLSHTIQGFFPPIAFKERKGEREKHRCERSIDWLPPVSARAGDLTCTEAGVACVRTWTRD